MITAKLWQDTRPKSAKGSGVAKALKLYESSGCAKGYPAKSRLNLTFFESATVACNELEKAFNMAVGKCNNEKKDTKKRDATLKLLAASQKELARMKDAVRKGQTEYRANMKKFEKDRRDLANLGAQMQRSAEAIYQKALKLDNDVRDREKKAKVMFKDQTMPPNKLIAAGNILKKLIDETKKYKSDAKDIFFGPVGSRYSKLKTSNPGHYDVQLADIQKQTSATEFMRTAASAYKVADDCRKRTTDRCDSIERSLRELIDSFATGAKTLQKSIATAEKLNAEVTPVCADVFESQKKFEALCKKTLPEVLRVAGGKPIESGGKKTDEEVWRASENMMFVQRSRFEELKTVHERLFDKYERMATRGMKRIGNSAMSNPQVKRLVGRVEADYQRTKGRWETLQKGDIAKIVKGLAKSEKVCKEKIAKHSKKKKK